MLDIRFIRENADLVQKSADAKRYKVSVADVLKVDEEKRGLQQQVDDLRAQRNDIAAQMKGGKPDPELIAKGKEIKTKLADLEERLKEADSRLTDGINSLPNIIFDDVPMGGEEDSVPVAEWGERKKTGVDHLDYAVSRDWVDFERGARWPALNSII